MEFIADKEIRLDKYLASKLPTISRSKLSVVIKKNLVSVNGKAKKANYLLRIGEKIFLADDFAKIFKKNFSPAQFNLKIHFENSDFAIIEKPAHLKVHPANLEDSSLTLINLLKYHFKSLANSDSLRPGIVHRLDKETSGLMIIVKTNKAYESFKKLFSDRKIEKEYLALVLGKISPEKGIIDYPIQRSEINPLKMELSKNGKEARTAYETVKIYDKYSLLKVHLLTGRTHQIRLHLTGIGFPICGDEVYGRHSMKKKKAEDCPRLFLHCQKLGFSYKNKKYSFESELPKDLSDFLASL